MQYATLGGMPEEMTGGALAGPRGAGRALHRTLVGTRPGLVGLALIIGLGAGLGSVLFHELILGVTWLVTGRADFSDAGRVASTHLPVLGFWFLLVAPVLGGLVYGPLVQRFAPEARGHGVPEVMVAVARNGGRIPATVAGVKALASGICIGTGGSVGREGPIVQIGSALGSAIGQWLRVPSTRMVLMVCCGAAGGISATFDAPISGVVFGLELILRSFSAEAFGVLVISSVTANVVAKLIAGDTAILTLPHFELGSAASLPLYAVLGLLAGLLGWAFARILYVVEDACDRVWRGPEWLRPAVGGLLLGALLLALPQMYGVGYPVLENAIESRYALGFLLLLVVGKILASSLTIGIGGSGGVFAPSLFVGGTAGTAFGIAASAAFPALDLNPGAFGLVGMAAVFAGAAHAPITAVLIVFELTGDYALILPLMAAVVLATGLSNLVSRDTIYTLKLLRRGIDIAADTPVDEALRRVTVGELMRPVEGALVPRGTPLVDERPAAGTGVASDGPGPAPADPGPSVLGADAAPADPGLPVLGADTPVRDVLDLLARHRGTRLAVRDTPDGPVRGTLAEHDVLDHLRGVGSAGIG
ncbi:chloride channel protein [Pseudonocardia nantongensis]|uniref:chloride channel protein n=1 Tax=Pseudonocardia nantongensis TaxID=1181885 RepID=UPI00397C27A8